MLEAAGCATISVNYMRMYYEMQLPIGKPKYTVSHITPYVRVHMIDWLM